MKHIRKFNKLNISVKRIRKFNISEGTIFDSNVDIGKRVWGSDIEEGIREIFQDFYDLIWEKFTGIKFSPSGNRIAIQFSYNNIFNNVAPDKVGEVMIKTWTELDLGIKKFQSLYSCKLAHINTTDSTSQELYSINWNIRLFFDKIY